VTSTFIEQLGLHWAFRQDATEALKHGHSIIINLDDKGCKGTHWVAARLIHKKLYYADPFGTLLGGYPPEELRILGPCIANRITFQRPKSTLCGYYAICFALAMDAYADTLPSLELSQKDFEELLLQSIT
jgi:hypothetical protein